MIEKIIAEYANEPKREWLAYPMANGDIIVLAPEDETTESIEQFKDDLRHALGE